MLYTLIMDMLKFIVDINLSRNSFLFSILLAQKNYSNRLMRLFCFVSFRWRGEVHAGLVWSRTADTNSYTKIFLFFFFVWTKAAIYYVAVLRRFMVMTIHASCSGWQFQNRKKKNFWHILIKCEREKVGLHRISAHGHVCVGRPCAAAAALWCRGK